jgi:anti-sigma B factor antagonist
MKFQTQEQDTYTLVSLGAEKLDSNLSPDLKGHIINLASKNPDKDIIIDLENVRFADSSGLSALLLAHRICRDNARTCVFVKPSPKLIILFEISQLNKVFQIADSIDEAVATLNKEG